MAPTDTASTPSFSCGEGKKRKLNHRFLDFCTVCAVCFVTAIWCHRPTGPNTTCLTYIGNTMCYLNKTTQTHENIYTHRLQQTKKANFSLLSLSFHWTTILLRYLHSGCIKYFKVRPISPVGLHTWVFEWTCMFVRTCDDADWRHQHH